MQVAERSIQKQSDFWGGKFILQAKTFPRRRRRDIKLPKFQFKIICCFP